MYIIEIVNKVCECAKREMSISNITLKKRVKWINKQEEKSSVVEKEKDTFPDTN